MRTNNLNEAVLELMLLIGHYFPASRKSDMGDKLRAATAEVRHHAANVQLGRVNGDPRDLLKLALKHCGAQGVSLGEVSDLINAHQEAHAGVGARSAGGAS